MPTPIKPRRRKPPTKGQPSPGFPRARGTTARGTAEPPRTRTRFPRTSTKPAANGPAGLIGRVQATLPGRKPPAKKSAVKGLVSSLGSARSNAVAHKPSKKGLIGIAAGGLGIAAMAKRRRGENEDETPTTQPVQPIADPNAPAS